MSAKLITGTDLQLLRRYDHKSEEIKSNLLAEDGAPYIRTFLTILRNVSKEDTIEYILALLDDLLTVDRKRAVLFQHPSLHSEEIYGPFVRLLSKINWYIEETSCRILALILSSRPSPGSSKPSREAAGPSGEAINGTAPSEDVQNVQRQFIEWLCKQLSQPSHVTRSGPAAITALSSVLREPSARQLFVAAGGVPLLVPFVTPASSQQQMQLVYESCLCVWLLSFHPSAVQAIAATRMIPQLVEVAKSSTKEKIVRVVVLSLDNFLHKSQAPGAGAGGQQPSGPSSSSPAAALPLGAMLVAHGVYKVVQSLQLQTWHDEDLNEALKSLDTGLRRCLKAESSFDKFKAEVLSGKLDWTPVHKDSAFWKENVGRFEENDFQVLRVLVTLLETSHDPRTLAVACHDIGQFVQSHPSGRIIASDLKAKEKVMRLLEYADADVQKQALLCVQRLLLSAKYVSFIR